jgi:hypothetical protein
VQHVIYWLKHVLSEVPSFCVCGIGGYTASARTCSQADRTGLKNCDQGPMGRAFSQGSLLSSVILCASGEADMQVIHLTF